MAELSKKSTDTQEKVAYVAGVNGTARHPGLELSLAVFSALASTWLLVDVIKGSINVFGARVPSFDVFTAFLMGNLSGYEGVIVAGLASVLFGVVSWWLFRRVDAAISSGKYKAVLQVGAGISIVKTGALIATALGVALTPLLTLREGVGVGAVYVYEFLPLILATFIFGVLTWLLVGLMGTQRRERLLSALLVVATSIVLAVGIVAVTINSHSGGLKGEPSAASQNSASSWTEPGRSGQSSACYEQYMKDRDIETYSNCLRD